MRCKGWRERYRILGRKERMVLLRVMKEEGWKGERRSMEGEKTVGKNDSTMERGKNGKRI